jgi:hypothetical protein
MLTWRVLVVALAGYVIAASAKSTLSPVIVNHGPWRQGLCGSIFGTLINGMTYPVPVALAAVPGDGE